MDLIAFAAERDETLTDLAQLYEPAVEEALAEPTEDARTETLMIALAAAFILMYGEEGGDEADQSTAVAVFLDVMRSAVELLVPDESSDAAKAAQLDRMTNWFATATLGAATLAASQSNVAPGDSEPTKTWITMRDDDVRDIHAAIEGETKDISERFTVKSEPSAELSFPGEPVGPPEAWINCRCVLAIDMSPLVAATEEPMIEEVVIEDEVVDGEPPIPDELLPGEDENQPVYGVAVPEGVESGDKRMFAEGSLTHRDLPLPLTWQRAAAQEHEGEVVVGRIDTLENRDGVWHWAGEILADVPEAEEVINLIAQGALRGVSIAADSGVMSEPTDEEIMAAMETGEMPPAVWDSARISGLTIVQIPAFQESFISLGEDPAALAAAGDVDTFKRGSGWITHPEETKTLHHYWTKGKGAAKIRWGTNGDFTRCTRQLRKYIEPRFLNRTCAQWHHDALGYWPGELGKPGNPVTRNSNNCDTPECQDLAMIAASADQPHQDFRAPELTMVAAAPPVMAPREAFNDPQFAAPTALVVKDGLVYGHIATWDVCHIGIDKQCVTAPKSKTDYAHFHLGAIDTDEGLLSVGSLTLGTGHADLKLSANSTTAHYDHTGTQVAKVRAGEDAFGIWVAGVVCEGVTDEQARTLQAAGGISGDWRSIGGNLELVAALAVNVPGFPVQRPALAASGSLDMALVAAGVVVAKDDPQVSAIAAAVLSALDERESRKAKLAALQDVQAAGRAKRLADLGI